MPSQPELYPHSPSNIPSAGLPEPVASPEKLDLAPIWLQRLSLFVLVCFCFYLGVLLLIAPWWPRLWDENHLFLMYPALSHFAHSGFVRGVVSGLGLLNLWIGASEAIHYEEYRPPR
jgi:hypothetical protein